MFGGYQIVNIEVDLVENPQPIIDGIYDVCNVDKIIMLKNVKIGNFKYSGIPDKSVREDGYIKLSFIRDNTHLENITINKQNQIFYTTRTITTSGTEPD